MFEKLPSKIVRLGEVAGGLCREIAEHTGLKAGIPVAGGGADAYIGVVTNKGMMGHTGIPDVCDPEVFYLL